MKRFAARTLGDQREHDEAAVAVRELLACGELRRMPVEYFEVLLGRRELLHRDRQHVRVAVEVDLLVEIVADPRTVRQEMLDRYVIADEREIVGE
jgi:hypothetical protein